MVWKVTRGPIYSSSGTQGREKQLTFATHGMPGTGPHPHTDLTVLRRGTPLPLLSDDVREASSQALQPVAGRPAPGPGLTPLCAYC